MNDEDRRQWVENDEGLYNEWKRSGLSIREYIRRNRKWLTRVIEDMQSGRKRPHHLAYPERREQLFGATSAKRTPSEQHGLPTNGAPTGALPLSSDFMRRFGIRRQ